MDDLGLPFDKGNTNIRASLDCTASDFAGGFAKAFGCLAMGSESAQWYGNNQKGPCPPNLDASTYKGETFDIRAAQMILGVEENGNLPKVLVPQLSSRWMEPLCVLLDMNC